ncbi:hypothetical protein, partial [Burkholderia ubonensis]|uniref:hypothetical protein n=1 Tax=Burkholderia ubonensis TaxID=101571 RepID=UPI001E5EBE62
LLAKNRECPQETELITEPRSETVARKAEVFLVSGRGNQRIDRPPGVNPRPVTKKTFVLNCSTGDGSYGH